MKKAAVACAVGLLLTFGSLALSQDKLQPVYKDPSARIPDRVRDLLGRMTTEEKVAQLEGGWDLPAIGTFKLPSIFDQNPLDDEKVRKVAGDGLGTYSFLGEFLATGDPSTAKQGAQRRNLLQAWVLKNTRWGIPILFHGEALHGAVPWGGTSFPEAVGLGSTWDPELLEKMFTTVALESRAAGNALVLAPVLDLSRDPRYGRVEEMYSEDPYLVSRLGIAAVRGLQGSGDCLDDNHVFATAKHFVHGQPENGTNAGPSDLSERTMRSVFLYPFQEAVEKAHIEAVMPSYNETNGGIPSNANPWLLKEVLRKEWGFTGLTVSDYLAVDELASRHHVAANTTAAGLLAFKSGVDMELPAAAGFRALVEAAKNGRVSMHDLDEAVSRVLSAKFRAGLFEHPYVDENRAVQEVGNGEHAKLARQVADESIVLLKNKGNSLPLDATKIRSIVVIGPNGKKERLGGYSALPPYYVSIVDGIQARAGAGTKVTFAEGCRISEPDTSPKLNTMGPYNAPDEASDRKLIAEGVTAAKAADIIVLALGGNEVVSRESIGSVGPGKPAFGDSDTLELPGRQDELIDEIVKLGKPTVAVLLNGKAYSIQNLSEKVPAIIEAWYPGQETGNAVAGILFGDVNPSGHLPVTIARNVGQLPVYYYKTPAARRGYVLDDNTSLYPFGYALSYTTFSFGKPTTDRDQITSNQTAHVSIKVTNTGNRAGDEVVQMYVHHVVSSVVQPVIALHAFKRVHLEPGSSTIVSFEVGFDQLAILDAQMKRAVEPGPVDILIGSSSAATSAVRLNINE